MITYNKKYKTIYYKDELKDNFGDRTPRVELGDTYKYERRGFYKFWSNFVLYVIAWPLCTIVSWFKGVKVIGKKNIKELNKKGTGYFIYSNHNGQFPVVMDVLLSCPKRCNIIGFSDAMYLKRARPFLRVLGYLPLPNSLVYFKRFESAMKYYIEEEKQSILIFPEATYWPYKIGTRRFVNTSFRYPVKYNVPIIPIYSGYRKRTGIYKLFGKKPLLTMSVGTPIYPKPELKVKENANFLGDSCYEQLVKLSNDMDQEIYIDYVQRVEEEERKKLTVCVVCDVYGSENNGTVAVENDLINYLKKQGHTVRILCADQDQIGKENFFVCAKRSFGPFNKYVEKNEVELAKIDMNVIKKALDGCDAVHIMMPFALGKAAAQYASKKGIPTTAGFHCQSENVLTHFFLKDVKLANKLLYKNFYRKMYKYVDTIHYPSEFIRQVFEKVSKLGNGIVISNAIKDGFKKLDGVEKPEKYKDKFVVLYAARLSKEKRQDLLVKCVKYLKNKEHIQIIIAGRGPVEAKLKKLIKKKGLEKYVEMTYIPHKELPIVLNWADLFVTTSQIDIESVSTIEAISCGLVPVLNDSTRSSGRFFALDNRNTFKDESPKDLAKKIDYWYENPEELKKCSQEYLKLTGQFDYDNCMAQMEEMIYLTIRNKKRQLNMKEVR